MIVALGTSYVLLAPVHLVAKGDERLRNFKQLCVTDQATGFNWKNGDWERADFRLRNYIVKKITAPKTIQEALDNGNLELLRCIRRGDKEFDSDMYKSYNACINIRRLGEDFLVFDACREAHEFFEETQDWVVTISCNTENFFFEPNGLFDFGYIHSDIQKNPKNDYKDSLAIEVGKCAGISE